jgi:hypothetical protein
MASRTRPTQLIKQVTKKWPVTTPSTACLTQLHRTQIARWAQVVAARSDLHGCTSNALCVGRATRCSKAVPEANEHGHRPVGNTARPPQARNNTNSVSISARGCLCWSVHCTAARGVPGCIHLRRPALRDPGDQEVLAAAAPGALTFGTARRFQHWSTLNTQQKQLQQGMPTRCAAGSNSNRHAHSRCTARVELRQAGAQRLLVCWNLLSGCRRQVLDSYIIWPCSEFIAAHTKAATSTAARNGKRRKPEDLTITPDPPPPKTDTDFVRCAAPEGSSRGITQQPQRQQPQRLKMRHRCAADGLTVPALHCILHAAPSPTTCPAAFYAQVHPHHS